MYFFYLSTSNKLHVVHFSGKLGKMRARGASTSFSLIFSLIVSCNSLLNDYDSGHVLLIN